MLVHQATDADHDRIVSFVLNDPLGWVDAEKYGNTFPAEATAPTASGSPRKWTNRRVCCVVMTTTMSTREVDCLWVDRDVTDRGALGASVLQTARRLQVHK